MDIIKDMLVQRGVKVFRLDGSTTEDRDTEIHDFNSHPGGCVFLIQIKAGGQGLNLQEASRVYITIPAWNPATELQAISRSHRKGQTRQVHIKKLVYVSDSDTPSIDESIVELQDHKSLVCADVLNDPRLSNQLPKLRKKFNMVKVFRKFFLTNT
jgi:SNF2 family DNA or RNA helicase